MASCRNTRSDGQPGLLGGWLGFACEPRSAVAGVRKRTPATRLPIRNHLDPYALLPPPLWGREKDQSSMRFRITAPASRSAHFLALALAMLLALALGLAVLLASVSSVTLALGLALALALGLAVL